MKDNNKCSAQVRYEFLAAFVLAAVANDNTGVELNGEHLAAEAEKAWMRISKGWYTK